MDRTKVAFICGSVRSGSTLLDLMLGRIEGFFSIGEFDAMLHGDNFSFDKHCACGEPFRECGFWTGVMEEAFGGLAEFDRPRLVKFFRRLGRNRHLIQLASSWKTPRFRRELAEYSRVLARTYRAISRVSGCRVIVDSSKVPNFGFALAASAELDLHVVHLVRDSRAVAYSHDRDRARAAARNAEPSPQAPGVVRIASGWCKANHLAGLLGRAGCNYTRVRYEDLARSPQATLRNVLRCVGEPGRSVPFKDRFLRKADTSHNVAGNWRLLSQEVVQIKPDLEWRAKMSRPRKLLVTALTWPLLLKYGYSLNASTREPERRS